MLAPSLRRAPHAPQYEQHAGCQERCGAEYGCARSRHRDEHAAQRGAERGSQVRCRQVQAVAEVRSLGRRARDHELVRVVRNARDHAQDQRQRCRGEAQLPHRKQREV